MLAHPLMKRLGVGLCSMMIIGSPIAASAAPPGAVNAPARAAAKDIVLGQDGSLTGYVRDANGRGKGNETVMVTFAGSPVAAVQTMEDGKFTISGLRAGTHSINASGTSWPVRLWQPQTAPPSAKAGVTLVSHQMPAGGCDQVVLVPNDPPVPCNPAPRHAHARRAGFLGRAFANYPVLTTAALLGAGIGAGIAIGTGSDSTPASP